MNELIEKIRNKSLKISEVLKIIIFELQNVPEKEYKLFKKELFGYDVAEEVPEYRNARTSISINDNGIIRDVNLEGHVDVINALCNTKIINSIPEIENFIEFRTSEFLMQPLEESNAKIILERSNYKATPFRKLEVTQMRNILSNAEIRVLEFLKDKNNNFSEISGIEQDIIKRVYKSCHDLLEIKESIHKEENKYNDIMRKLLERDINNNYYLMDQTRQGRSASQNKTGGVGEIDLKIKEKYNDLTITIFEAFRISNIDSAKIKLHLKKIFGYDVHGISFLIFLIYVESENFIDIWERYKDFISQKELNIYTSDDNNFYEAPEFVPDRYSNIKFGYKKHNFNGRLVKCYHFFINMK